MKAAFVGVGKMGFPVSLAHCLIGGHQIYAYDSNVALRNAIRNAAVPFHEPQLRERTLKALNSGKYHVCATMEAAVENADVVFVAVPTPSLPDNSFDTRYVVEAVNFIGHAIRNRKTEKFTAVVIISTVLPRTTRRYLEPALEYSSGKKVGEGIGLDYSASFIAMGTTFEDAVDPEFILVGASDEKTAALVKRYYSSIVPAGTPMLDMTYEEAELTKNVYNVHIGMKIIIANAVMEMAHKMGQVDCDKVTDALGKATKRVVGPKYLKGGMGDGGSCHGRDSLALSWVAKNLGLSADPFDYIMQARSAQADWLAKELCRYNLPVVIMGERYKPDTDLLDYSAAKLVEGFIRYYGRDVKFHDPVVGKISYVNQPSAFLIALPEEFVREYDYPKFSVILDVWRCFSLAQQERLLELGVRYIPVGVSTVKSSKSLISQSSQTTEMGASATASK